MAQVEWTNNPALLQNGIYQILREVITLEEAQKVLDGEMMIKVWAPAFTHNSFKNTETANYESLESYGDLYLDVVFIEYLTEYFKRQLTNVEINYFKTKYMSEQFQSQLAEKMGLDKLVRFDRTVIPDVTKKMKEDLFESFIGALYTAFRLRVSPYIGFAYINNLFVVLFRDIKFTLSEVSRDPISALKEIYDKMGMGLPDYRRSASDKPQLGMYKITLYDKHGTVVSVGYGDENTATYQAAENGLTEYAKRGITPERAQQESIRRNQQNRPEYDKQYNRAVQAFEIQKKYLGENGRAVPLKFDIQSTGSTKVDGQVVHSYGFYLYYSARDPNDPTRLDVTPILNESGTKALDVQISLLKKYADSIQVPQ